MDLIRGLSAVAVLIGHVRGVFFVDMRDVAQSSIALKAFYALSGLGHQAVVVFFVLSGFFIGTSVLGSTSAGRWSWRQFLLRRFTRLYVVLVPALILTLSVDLLGMHLFGTDNIYAGKVNAPFIHLFDARETLRLPSFLGNLFFLQYIFVDPYGTNAALWSLGYEFWSYVVFPLLVLGLAAWRVEATPLRVRVVYLLVAVGILGVAGKDFAFYFGVWLMGALVAKGWPVLARKWRVGRPVVGLAALAFFSVLLVARSVLRQSVGDVALGATTAVFFSLILARAAQVRDSDSRGRSAYARLAVSLAGFSYTLYLIHYPLLAIVNAAVIHGDRWQPTAPHLAACAALCLAIAGVAYAMARLTEGRTERVRAWAEQRLASARIKVGESTRA